MRRSRIATRCTRVAGTFAVALMLLAGGALATPAQATTAVAEPPLMCVEQIGDSYYLNTYIGGTLNSHLPISAEAASSFLLLGVPRC
jgi:hypothetical protein